MRKKNKHLEEYEKLQREIFLDKIRAILEKNPAGYQTVRQFQEFTIEAS